MNRPERSIFLREGVSRRDLVAATLIIAIALAVFTLIAAGVATGGMLVAADGQAAAWLHQRATPPMTDAMIVASLLGAPSTLITVTAVIGVMLVAARKYHQLIALLTLVIGGNLLNYCLKFVFRRVRPSFDDPLLTLGGYSFPSGHAMASTVFYGFVIAYLMPMTSQRRPAAIAAGVLVIGLVGSSRIYLGVHYMSDVVAGMVEAIGWSTLVLTMLRLARVHPRDIGSWRRSE